MILDTVLVVSCSELLHVSLLQFRLSKDVPAADYASGGGVVEPGPIEQRRRRRRRAPEWRAPSRSMQVPRAAVSPGPHVPLYLGLGPHRRMAAFFGHVLPSPPTYSRGASKMNLYRVPEISLEIKFGQPQTTRYNNKSYTKIVTVTEV